MTIQPFALVIIIYASVAMVVELYFGVAWIVRWNFNGSDKGSVRRELCLGWACWHFGWGTLASAFLLAMWPNRPTLWGSVFPLVLGVVLLLLGDQKLNEHRQGGEATRMKKPAKKPAEQAQQAENSAPKPPRDDSDDDPRDW